MLSVTFVSELSDKNKIEIPSEMIKRLQLDEGDKIEVLIKENNNLNKEKELLLNQKKKLEKDKNLHNELIGRYNLTSETYDALSEIYKNFTLSI